MSNFELLKNNNKKASNDNNNNSYIIPDCFNKHKEAGMKTKQAIKKIGAIAAITVMAANCIDAIIDYVSDNDNK